MPGAEVHTKCIRTAAGTNVGNGSAHNIKGTAARIAGSKAVQLWSQSAVDLTPQASAVDKVESVKITENTPSWLASNRAKVTVLSKWPK